MRASRLLVMPVHDFAPPSFRHPAPQRARTGARRRVVALRLRIARAARRHAAGRLGAGAVVERAGRDEHADLARAVVAAFRRPDCSPRWSRTALQANTDVRSAQAALRQARALRDVSAAQLTPLSGHRRRRSAPTPRATARARAMHSGPASTRAGSPTSSAATRSALSAAKPTRRPARRAWATCRCRSPPRWRVAYIALRGTQARAGDRAQQPREPAGDAADHAVAHAGRAWRTLARRRAGARRHRADARADSGAATAHAAQTQHSLAVLTGRAPAALHDRCWRRRRAVPQPRRPRADASRPTRCASAPTCAPPKPTCSAAARAPTQADAAALSELLS